MLLADRWPPLAVALAFALGGLALQLSLPMGHDLAWLVHAAGRLLDGADVYGRDLVEWNPPANLQLLLPPAAISHWTDLPVWVVVRVWLALIVGAALSVANAVARAAFGPHEAPLRRWTLVALVFALYVAVDESFGQREHVITALLLPQILLAAAVRAGRTPAAGPSRLAGAMAAFAIAMKPHYAVLVAAMEVVLLVRGATPTAWKRADLRALGLVVALEAGAVLLWTPGYATEIVPLALDSYWVYQAHLARIVEWGDLAWLAAGAGAAGLLWGRVDAFRVGAFMAGAASVFYAIAMWQRTGWDYHLVPMRVIVVGLAAMALLRPLTAHRAHPGDRSARPVVWRASAACAAGALALALLMLAPTRYGRVFAEGGVWRSGGTEGFVAVLQKAMIEHASGGTVYVISPSLVSVFPAVQYAGVAWGSRFAGFYLPAAVVRQRRGDAEVPARLDSARAKEIETYLRDAVVEDLHRDPPDLILVDTVKRRKVFAGVPFDFVDFLDDDPRFAEIWARYHRIRRVGRFDAYVPR